jgi:hypothetical protein
MTVHDDGRQALNGIGRITYTLREDQTTYANVMNTIEGEFRTGMVEGWNRWICCMQKNNNLDNVGTFYYEGQMKDRKRTKYNIAPHEEGRMLPQPHGKGKFTDLTGGNLVKAFNEPSIFEGKMRLYQKDLASAYNSNGTS